MKTRYQLRNELDKIYQSLELDKKDLYIQLTKLKEIFVDKRSDHENLNVSDFLRSNYKFRMFLRMLNLDVKIISDIDVLIIKRVPAIVLAKKQYIDSIFNNINITCCNICLSVFNKDVNKCPECGVMV